MRKMSFCTKGYAEIYIQRLFFDIEKRIWKIFCIENPNGVHMLWCPFYTWKFLFMKKTKISVFGGISKFLELIVFGQILVVLGSFWHWQWLTTCSKFT
jgi:hypothetical protein